MDQADHILIVDDDRDIRELLTTYLQKNGFKVTAAANGRQMRAALEVGTIDLIVLDLMLPGEDGLVLCRDLRAGENKAVPILMLTARSEETDRIVGLEMGADDYLSKPFASRELVARIRAVLRRTRMLPPNMRVGSDEAAPMLAFGDWRLDTVARHLLDASGTMVMLSGAEYRLLQVFCRSSPEGADPRPAAEPDPGAGCGIVRPLDRLAGEPLAPALAGRCARTALYQNRAQ